MKIVTDLNVIEQSGVINEDVNWRFRTFLKGIDSEIVDQKVQQIYKEIMQQTDCTECGNCCTKLQPLVKENEIRRIAEDIGMHPGRFVENYLEYDLEENEYRFEKIPCFFYHDKRCKIYASRPADCSSYPHLGEKGFVSRLISIIFSYSICPIVYNVYERLKEAYRFR